ncbi:MAG: ComF family protein [Bacteroidales bacterium]|nr:ComF family protein [Bacteroidales bacterium]
MCGKRLNVREKYLCLDCEADLPLTRYATRDRNPMADKFNGRIQERLDTFEPYSYASALFFYHEGYKEITRGLKYDGRIGLGKEFGRRLGMSLAASPLYRDVDAVVPVPLHWTRRYRRGYNQAEVIAGAVARELGAPLRRSFLRRARRTRSQAKLSTESKAANVAGAFKASGRGRRFPWLPPGTPAVEVHHILLIDDVFTTGSTLAACHAALREAFGPAVRISAATLACAAD